MYPMASVSVLEPVHIDVPAQLVMLRLIVVPSVVITSRPLPLRLKPYTASRFGETGDSLRPKELVDGPGQTPR